MRSKNKTKIFAFFSSFLPSYPPTHNHRNTQEEMNFRNQVCRGTHAPCSLLLCLAHVGRTHLAFQTGTIYTPPSPQRVSLYPFLPHLVYQGSVEKRPRCHLVQAVADLSSTFCCRHTKPIHLLPTLFLPFLLQLYLMHRCGQCRRGHILWVLPTHSSSSRALLPLAPWCKGSNPAHGSFQLQETHSQGKPSQMRVPGQEASC